MSLNSEQLKLIEKCTKDEECFNQIVSLINDIQSTSTATEPSPALSLDLDPEQFELLQVIVESFPVPTYVKDTESRFVLANQLTVEMVGRKSFDEIRGKNDFDFYEYERAKFHFDEEQEIFRTGQPLIELELTSILENGSQDWHRSTKAPIRDKQGKIIGLVGINREITEEKLSQIKLVEEHKLLRTIIDNIHDKVYVKDRQSRFLIANSTTVKAHKLTTHDELVGTTDFDYVDAELAQQLFEQEQAVIQTGQAVVNVEYVIPANRSGDIDRYFLVSKLPLKDENGNISSIVGVNREITSRKIAEQQRLDLELERERINLLSDFITHSAHEFRTPISVIQTATYLMKNTDNPEKVSGYIERIESQTRRLSKLIESLNTMSRLDNTTALEFNSVPLRSLITAIFERTKAQLREHDLTIELTFDDIPRLIRGDADDLGKAIGEILENAIRYTPDGGNVTVHAYTENHIPIIAIQDTGMGMSEDIMSKIFRRFYRADEAHTVTGFGLGLPIANKIVQLHNGYIEVESELHKGSTFRILLPQISLT